MKRFMVFGIAVCLLICSGCASFVKYDAQLSEVVSKSKTIDLSEDKGLSYSDENISIDFDMKHTQMEFKLKNKTKDTIFLDWNRTVFINVDNEAKRITHKGVRYQNSAQAGQMVSATMPIPAGTILSDLIAMAEGAHYIAGAYGTGRWYGAPILPIAVGNTEGQAIERAEKHIGKEFTIILPLEIKGERQEYRFVFNITSFRVVGVSEIYN